jgi:hypothetical protein
VTGGGKAAAANAVSLILSDVEVEATTVISAFQDATLISSAAEVTFNTFGEIEQTGSGTQYLDLFTSDGELYRVPFDQAVGDTGKNIARDLADTINVWPNNGRFPYRATVQGNRVQINNVEGQTIRFALIHHTNDSEVLQEEFVIGVCEGGECRGNVKPFESPTDPFEPIALDKQQPGTRR